MRILIHGINFAPELTGIGKYSGEMAEWLAAQGHEVRVVTAPPYYPQWRIADGYANAWRKEQVQGEGQGQGIRVKVQADVKTLEPCALPLAPVVVYRCPLWVPEKPSGLKRLLHLGSFALSSIPVMLRQIFWRPDVVWVVEPPLFCAPMAWLVARLSGGKAWLHIQDYEVDAAFDLGLLKGAVLRGMVTAGERWLMRRFDRVSTISQRMVDRALAKGVAPERAVLFPNWVDIKQDQGSRCKVQGENQGQGSSSKVQGENQGQGSSSKVQGENQVQGSSSKVQDKASNYRAELEISEDAVVALYSGNMGGKQGLEILAQVAKIQVQEARCKWQETRFKAQETRFKAQDTRFKAQAKQSERSLAPCTLPLVPEIIFVFCGNGAGRAELVVLCEGLGNVRFLDLQPLERLGELLSFADIHLLPQRADAADLVMPSKLTGMLASGRPVVATANEGTELANVVSGCGMVVPPEQPHAFLDAIMILAKDAELRRQLGCAGRAYAVANLDRDAVLGRFEAELKAVTRCKIQGID